MENQSIAIAKIATVLFLTSSFDIFLLFVVSKMVENFDFYFCDFCDGKYCQKIAK
jgi:hypothetical protein